jgi:hypothetical protein
VKVRGSVLALGFPLCLFLLAQVSSAQGVASLIGTVVDPSGTAVPSATVTATEVGTRFSRVINTNAQGYYTIPSLRPTKYTLTVKAAGFRDFEQTDITLQAEESATVNVKLELGATNETVVVSAQADQVDTATPTLRQIVDDKRIVEIPLNGRNAASLTLTVAGASIAPNQSSDQGNTKTFPAVVYVSANGARMWMWSYKLDGGNNEDELTNVNLPFPFPDALQEFSVQTSNYSAEYGENAGGVVNVITKSGTNELHGTGFGFMRNAVLNARNFFAARRDQLKRGQEGGVIGGPVYIPRLYNGRDHTFFFFGYQYTTIRSAQATASGTVPTSADLSGDFSSLLSATNPANPLGKPTTVLDPITGQPFAGNLIPTSRFDPAALTVAKYLPQAAGDGLVFFTKPIAQNYNEEVVKVDHSFGDSDRLGVRYYRAKFHDTGIYTPDNLLTYYDEASILSQNALVQETHIFRPSLLNDMHLTYIRKNAPRGAVPGVPNMNDLGVNVYNPPEKFIESISVSGFFTIGDRAPARFVESNYTLTDDLRWVHGRHSMSFGFYGQVGRDDIVNDSGRVGTYGFTSDVTNFAIASFLLGKMRTFTQSNGQFKNDRGEFYGLYAQDSFRVNGRLTLNYGLRWEPATMWKEIRGRVVQFRPWAYWAGQTSQVFSNAPPGEFFYGDPGVPEGALNTNFKPTAPRVGFAYDLTGDGKASLRGGVGMFYDTRVSGMTNQPLTNLTPYSPQLSYTTPAGSFSNPLNGQPNPYPAPFPPLKNASFPTPVQVCTYNPTGEYFVPVSYNWNLTLERAIASNWLVRAGYVGSHASHIFESVETNPAVYTPGSTLSTDARRIFQPFGSITLSSQAGNSGYNSAQLSLERRFSQGFTIRANYTWSKSLDNTPYGANSPWTPATGNGFVYPIYFHNASGLDTGPSDFDVSHRFVISYVWQLPVLARAPRLARGVLGNWQLAGLFQTQSGLPLTVDAGTDRSQTGLGKDRAVLVGDPYGAGACGQVAPCVNYLNPSAFALPAIGSFGNVGKGLLRNPGMATWDVGLFKSIPIHEKWHLQFRAEFFNVLNRVNLQAPGEISNSLISQTNVMSDAHFGSFLSADDPRIGQLALKILF